MRSVRLHLVCRERLEPTRFHVRLPASSLCPYIFTAQFMLSQDALLSAAESGKLEVIKQLRPSPEFLNQAANDGATPLFLAAKNGHVAVVEELLKIGADQNPLFPHRITPTWIAAQAGHHQVLEVGYRITNLSAIIGLVELWC